MGFKRLLKIFCKTFQDLVILCKRSQQTAAMGLSFHRTIDFKKPILDLYLISLRHQRPTIINCALNFAMLKIRSYPRRRNSGPFPSEKTCNAEKKNKDVWKAKRSWVKSSFKCCKSVIIASFSDRRSSCVPQNNMEQRKQYIVQATKPWWKLCPLFFQYDYDQKPKTHTGKGSEEK